MPRLFRVATWAVVLIACAIGAIAVFRGWHRAPDFTYEPEAGTSTLDGPGGLTLAKDDSTCVGLPRRWMVIGWDGADWDLLIPLLRHGKMPHLARLIDAGTVADLATFRPSISPALWTTVVTGVSPQRHGIRHFYDQKPRLERWLSRLRHFGQLPRQLFDNTDRRVPALWNLLTEHGRQALVAGYHNTFPVEPIDGIMLSNYLVQEHVGDRMGAEGVLDSRFADSLVYPEEIAATVSEVQAEVRGELPQAIQRFVHFADDAELREFLRKARELREDDDQRPYFATRAWLFDEIYHRAVLRLYPELEPDVLLLHQQGVDWASHQFLNFHAPEKFARFDTSTREWQQVERLRPIYRDTLGAVYQDQDRKLGELLALRPPETAVMILSDHGFEAHDDPDEPGFHDNAPAGILVLAGPGIRSGARLERATIYDVLPTLMASLGLPVAQDVEGRVLDEAFCPALWQAQPVQRIATYGEGQFVPRVARPDALEKELVQQLESLGYLD